MKKSTKIDIPLNNIQGSTTTSSIYTFSASSGAFLIAEIIILWTNAAPKMIGVGTSTSGAPEVSANTNPSGNHLSTTFVCSMDTTLYVLAQYSAAETAGKGYIRGLKFYP